MVLWVQLRRFRLISGFRRDLTRERSSVPERERERERDRERERESEREREREKE